MRHHCQDDRNPRACAWHFSFHLSANMIDQIRLVLGRPLGSAKILSYAMHECSASDIEVTGFFAGGQLRHNAAQAFLSDKEVRNLQLTQIVGDRSLHPLIRTFRCRSRFQHLSRRIEAFHGRWHQDHVEVSHAALDVAIVR